MIDIIFEFGTEVIFVRVVDKTITFANSTFGSMFAPIEGINITYAGVCREFPDLETRNDWKEVAIKRFKEKIKAMKTEEEVANYVIEDLRSHGYIPKYKQVNGWRKEKL